MTVSVGLFVSVLLRTCLGPRAGQGAPALLLQLPPRVGLVHGHEVAPGGAASPPAAGSWPEAAEPCRGTPEFQKPRWPQPCQAASGLHGDCPLPALCTPGLHPGGPPPPGFSNSLPRARSRLWSPGPTPEAGLPEPCPPHPWNVSGGPLHTHSRVLLPLTRTHRCTHLCTRSCTQGHAWAHTGTRLHMCTHNLDTHACVHTCTLRLVGTCSHTGSRHRYPTPAAETPVGRGQPAPVLCPWSPWHWRCLQAGFS